MTFYAYIQKRIEGRRMDSIVQDLIDDMKRDKELQGKTGAEIVSNIRWKACSGANEALNRFISSQAQEAKNWKDKTTHFS